MRRGSDSYSLLPSLAVGSDVADRGPQGSLVWGKHGFLMCMSDLLATGQPSKVKRVWPGVLLTESRVPGSATPLRGCSCL